jgi:hypothetical protein
MALLSGGPKKMLEWPYGLPPPPELTLAEIERLRGLTVEERLRELMEVISKGHELLMAAPNCDEILAAMERSEEAWREAHRKVFAKFGF